MNHTCARPSEHCPVDAAQNWEAAHGGKWGRVLVLVAACLMSNCATARVEPGASELQAGSTRQVIGAPESGLPYRLHVPSGASRAHRARLIVWLHPGWAHDNDEVEQLAGAFAKRGYALLVPTQPLSVRGWSAMESGALLASTLPDVEARGEVDTSRPVLLGHGAGGDQALELWLNEPCRFRGIAVSSARPLLAGRSAGEALELLEGCTGRAPVLAVLGEVDRAAREWRSAEPSWRTAGVSLTVRVARMRGYKEWLFEGPQAQALLRWLEGLDALDSSSAANVAEQLPRP